jgi:GAF domain-containing protein/HAMP domain-containing protein
MNNDTATPLTRIQNRMRRLSLGTRLTLLLLPLILIPMLVVVGVTYQRSRNILRQQAVDQLTTAAQAQVRVLEEWTAIREQRIQLGSQRTALIDPLSQLLPASSSSIGLDDVRTEARSQLASLKTREGQGMFVDLLAVRLSDSVVIASTTLGWEGKQLPLLSQNLFEIENLGSLPIYNDSLLNPENVAIITFAPMRLARTQAIDAVLIGINSDLRLSTLMEEMQVFWEQRGVFKVVKGETYIVLAPDVTLRLERYGTAPVVESGLDHPVLQRAQTAPSGVVEYIDNKDQLVLGAFEWIPEWELGIVVELPQENIFAEFNQLAPFITVVFIVVVTLVAVSVPFSTQRAIRPLGDLADFAERLARGDLLHRVTQQREDEIGRLAAVFNKMADDLSDMYGSLEMRVQERTRQIQTASEIARDAVAIREMNTLLDQVVHLISDRFGFYHTGVFLTDQSGEFAVLRAASSEGGEKMLREGHQLAVGKSGIVGYVTGTGNPRIALDVGTDTYHLTNPNLPETRSEIALPLRSGAAIIGALDVQSKEPNAFSEDDLFVLQTMADQLAVAIENARLIEAQSRVAIQRRNVIDIYNRMTGQLGYTRLLKESTEIIRSSLGFPGVILGLVEGDQLVIRSVSSKGQEREWMLQRSVPLGRGVFGRTIASRAPQIWDPSIPDDILTPPQQDARPPTVICVPIISRGTVIGALATQMPAQSTSESETIEVIELLASHVANSLENARLFEETQQSLEQVDALYRQQTAAAWHQLLPSMATSSEDSVFEYGSENLSIRDFREGDLMEMPISLRGEILGSLGILSDRRKSWSEDEQAILGAVADEVANALEQVRLMDEIHRRATQLQTAAEIARDATGFLDLDTLIQRAVNLIYERFGLYHVSIFLLDRSEKHAIVRESAGEAGERLKEEKMSIDVGSKSIVGYVSETGESYLAHDVNNDPYYLENVLLPDTRTELVIPLKIGDRVIGALDVHHNLPHAFTEDDRSIFEILADQIAITIQNARLFETTLRRAEREQAVLKVTSAIRASNDIDGMLQTAVHELRQVLGAKHGRVQLVEAPAGISSDFVNPSTDNRVGDTPTDTNSNQSKEAS